LYDITCAEYNTAYYNQQCSQNPQYDINCMGYIEPIIVILDPIIITQPTITDDPIVDEIISLPPVIVLQVEDINPIIVEPISEPVVVTIASARPEAVTVEPVIEITIVINKLQDDIEQEINKLEVVEAEIVELEVVEDAGGGPRGNQIKEDSPTVEVVVEKPKKKELSEAEKSRLKKEKIKKLIANKVAILAKQMGEAVTLEMQKDTQNRILALIGFVPEFNQYTKGKKLDEVTFYPDKPVVDHQYARWFLNDPNFSELEDLQYPNGFK